MLYLKVWQYIYVSPYIARKILVCYYPKKDKFGEIYSFYGGNESIQRE